VLLSKKTGSGISKGLLPNVVLPMLLIGGHNQPLLFVCWMGQLSRTQDFKNHVENLQACDAATFSSLLNETLKC
jgi:hypothetical protein